MKDLYYDLADAITRLRNVCRMHRLPEPIMVEWDEPVEGRIAESIPPEIRVGLDPRSHHIEVVGVRIVSPSRGRQWGWDVAALPHTPTMRGRVPDDFVRRVGEYLREPISLSAASVIQNEQVNMSRRVMNATPWRQEPVSQEVAADADQMRRAIDWMRWRENEDEQRRNQARVRNRAEQGNRLEPRGDEAGAGEDGSNTESGEGR